MMAKILTNTSVRQAHVLAVARWMANQPLATGLTIDYESGLPQNMADLSTAEQAAGWSGLSLDEAVDRLSNDYTELIREIAAAVHRQHRLVRLMAPVRDSDDVDVATTDIAPYLLDYGALTRFVDQVVLKAYDFNFATGNPGPIAPDGPLVKFPSFVFLPRPKRPPIWIGGNGAAAMNRALKFGDGWHPLLPAAELKVKVEELKTRARAAGRDVPEIIVRRGFKLDDIGAARAKVAAEKEAGTTYFIFDLGRYPDEQSFGKSVETFMTKVAG